MVIKEALHSKCTIALSFEDFWQTTVEHIFKTSLANPVYVQKEVARCLSDILKV
jgi:hypothetical protein